MESAVKIITQIIPSLFLTGSVTFIKNKKTENLFQTVVAGMILTYTVFKM